jgi:hypothetical protein
MSETSSYRRRWTLPVCKVLGVALFMVPSFAQAQINGAKIPIAKPPAANPVKLTAATPGLDDRLAPGLPLTDLEKVAIASAKADGTEPNLRALATTRHLLAQSYLNAADLSRDADALRAAILYAASAVELDPVTPAYRMTLGGLYSRYAAIEIVASFAALETLSSVGKAEAVPTPAAATPAPLASILHAHQDRMRVAHLEKTYQGARKDLYSAALERTQVAAAVSSESDDQIKDRIKALFADELRDLESAQKALATRRSRWQARMKELDQDRQSETADARDNVSAQLTRLNVEAEAIEKIAAQLKAWRDQDDATNNEAKSARPGPTAPVRPALDVARGILSLATSQLHQDAEAPLSSLTPEDRALVINARKAAARGWVEAHDSQSIADRDLIARLSRIAVAAAERVSSTVAGGPSPQNLAPDTLNTAALETPTLSLMYRTRPVSRPQLVENTRFIRAGLVDSSVPLGTILNLETHIDIPKSEPQPWIGYTWILHDKNSVNQKPVKINDVVSFNEKGNGQIGAHASDDPGPTVLNLPIPTGNLAPGPYEAIVATFYLSDNGTLDPAKAKATTAIARTSFELVEAEIDVYIDLPDRIASPGWTPLTTFASNWVKSPYTIEITLDNLMFRGTEETFVSAKGMSPMMKFGGITTLPNAPAHGDGSVTVQITDAQGRTANASRRLVIGGPPQAIIAPELSQAEKHPE